MGQCLLAGVGGGGSKTKIIITLAASDDASVKDRKVTVKNDEDKTEVTNFTYDGQPKTISIPVGMRYRIECDEMQHYRTPDPAVFMAVAGMPRAITMTYTYGVRYGFKRQKVNAQPDNRITYLFDAEGKDPAFFDFTAGSFHWGGWQEFVEAVARPVMLKNDGTVDYELDHNDQTKKKGENVASDVDNPAYQGNAMVEFGKAFKWVHRSEDADYETVIFCNVKYDDTYNCYAHTNAKKEEKDAFYWGMFTGTNVGNIMRSIGTGGPMTNQTRNTEVAYAKNNGEGYYTIYKSGWDYICDLLTLIAKSDHSQQKFGEGRSKSSNTSAIAVGSLKNTGPFYGSTNGTGDVKVLWIEGMWGNVWEGMAGLILAGADGIKTKMVPPYNFDGQEYAMTGISPGGTSGGYISEHKLTDENGFVPKTASGSATTYMCDGLWFDNGKMSYALVGGAWTSAGLCGARCVHLDHPASDSAANSGSRLSYLPA